MVEETDGQVDAASSSAKARQAIAERIRKLVPGVQKDADAQIILHLGSLREPCRRAAEGQSDLNLAASAS